VLGLSALFSLIFFVFVFVFMLLVDWRLAKIVKNTATTEENTRKLCGWMKRISEQMEEAEKARKRPSFSVEA
jgi:hypothetical protein